MTTPKFSFILRTQQDTGRISEKVLASTYSRDRAATLRRKFAKLLGLTDVGVRKQKKVRVLAVEPHIFRLFLQDPHTMPLKTGDIFDSVSAFADVVGANPSTARVTLAKGRREKKPSVIRGVTYDYAT